MLELNNDGISYCSHSWNDLVIGKPSHRIVELIELGDYVNGYPVTSINQSNGKIYEIEVKRPNNKAGVYFEKIKSNDDFKTIFTHEQFEREAYKV